MSLRLCVCARAGTADWLWWRCGHERKRTLTSLFSPQAHRPPAPSRNNEWWSPIAAPWTDTRPTKLSTCEPSHSDFTISPGCASVGQSSSCSPWLVQPQCRRSPAPTSHSVHHPRSTPRQSHHGCALGGRSMNEVGRAFSHGDQVPLMCVVLSQCGRGGVGCGRERLPQGTRSEIPSL